MPITCHFCPATVPDPEAAIDAGWIPSFWDTGKGVENASPVCKHCTETRLVWNDDLGDFEPISVPVVVISPPPPTTTVERVIIAYQRGLYETVFDAAGSPLLTTDAEREQVREALTPEQQ